MTLDELNSAVAAATGKPKADAAKSVTAVLHGIQDALTKGQKVSIAGFGVFEVTERPEREGRNPQTGERSRSPPARSSSSSPARASRTR